MNNFEVNDIDKQQKEDSLRRWKDAVIVKVMDKFQHIIGDEGFTEFKEFTKFYNNNTEFSDFFIIDYFFSNMEKFELKYLCYDQDYLNKFSQALSEFVGARVIEIVKACIKEVKSDKKFSEGFNFNPKKSSYFKIVGGNKDGVFQDSCRKNHAAFLKFFCVGLSGLSVTSATGVQFRVLPDQRVGCLSLAAA